MKPEDIGLAEIGAVLAALSALATAAFGLLDSTKAFWGGISNIGLKHIYAALHRFDSALDAAIGPGWVVTVRANWLNGTPKAQQKAVVVSLLKLGLTPGTAEAIAEAAHVDPQALAVAAKKLAEGVDLAPADVNVLGRMSVSLEALLDAAFESAEQQFHNVSRLLAGLICVALAVAAEGVASNWTGDGKAFALAVAVGLLAVPVAPIAKDLTSALSTAMRAIKATRAL